MIQWVLIRKIRIKFRRSYIIIISNSYNLLKLRDNQLLFLIRLVILNFICKCWYFLLTLNKCISIRNNHSRCAPLPRNKWPEYILSICTLLEIHMTQLWMIEHRLISSYNILCVTLYWAIIIFNNYISMELFLWFVFFSFCYVLVV